MHRILRTMICHRRAQITRVHSYISVGCSGRRVPSVLLDNGSALNVCPLATAIAIGYALSDFGPPLRLFPLGVLRIPTSFNLLLGQPWIHRAGAIPSSLHQKVKFIHDDSGDGGFLRDFVAMSFDQHSSTVVLDIMRSMSYLPGRGVKAHLTHTPFYYPVRPYTMSLADYFVRASEPHAPSDGIIGGLSTTRRPSFSASSSSYNRTSLMTLCFPDEIDDHGTFAEIGDVVDGAVPRDEYVDEMLAMSLSQTEEIAPPELASPFDLFGVSVLEIAEEIQVAPTPEVVEDVIVAVDLFDGPVGLVEGASDLVDPPLPLMFYRDLSPIFDIDDEIAQHDSDDDSSPDSDSDPVDQRVSPAVGDTEIVDFGTADQPRELRIGSICLQMREIASSSCSDPTWTFSHGPMRTCQALIHLSSSIVKEEIQKQLSVGFLSVVEYPEWLANVVPVPKRTASQILMAPEDMEKTSFITEWGTYCYRVMPFGLKNAGATYQRAATTLFHDMMHRDVEVYVDDMIVKSRDRSDHLAALERFFERIRQFRLRLNPKKCTFGVTSGKLLGYMVSERGIEVDPDKIRAILDMPAPRTERRSEASWADFSTSCQRAFERIREYLLSPPVLAPPTPGRPLLLYLSVSDVALGC
ncbi:Retrovirus-related Pol polyprotein from transposon 17.6 [Vitis vinifera]|uniref:Retrovirus-related Pol polyprotein from transposon 17.6 n=1 Tax=Vitis vinifera TaxID=29760 RepID=A0A438H099_VITVI|nr:Retrovirus-related Pol polyprotein from transposon 17.6 [Vitis vinifera]